ncbi:MAG TPA: bifunctional 2-polyprenyl-6-hydroxyphenol methylase/3-demethylubiquinol 3-O-methyltransferase UbiG [Beijerinckiaceae bacterium]|nr:bifunctional 2-polyprenyl-6-hydroxyphenol methylase/3-demethylubiquinol 3-O-methyltransferase UbiG [Beijerinckiaceae bacterium]
MNARASNSVDEREVSQFDRIGADWWDENGPMKPLHRINPVRLSYIRGAIAARFGRNAQALDALRGLSILDIGCGGGLLCEPLARMGAAVTGIDPAPNNIAVARAHAEGEGLAVSYVEGLAEDLVAGGRTFDVVLAMEVVEHVPDVAGFVATAAALVRPGGLFLGSTLNRTKRAYALAILGAEYVLRWLPVGTHRWEQFVTPEEFAEALTVTGLGEVETRGMVYNPLADRWHLSSDTAVNYFIAATRPA